MPDSVYIVRYYPNGDGKYYSTVDERFHATKFCIDPMTREQAGYIIDSFVENGFSRDDFEVSND